MRINLLVAVLVSLLALIFLSFSQMSLPMSIIISIMGFVIMFLIGLLNILLFSTGRKLQYAWPLKQPNKIWRYLLSFVLSPVIYILVWMPFSFVAQSDPFLWIHDVSFLGICVLSSLLISTLLTLIFNYYYFQHSKTRAELEAFKLKSIVSEASNQLLKQQIHPHFLFNVLTSIKSLYRQDINKGEAYLVHLANFLRASISEPGAKIVEVEEELKLCNDYIEMQRIRFNNALKYEVSDISFAKRRYLPFFSIQILLENAIKHNEFTEESPLHLQVLQDGNDILVINNLQVRHFKEPSTHQGLFNLSERYKLLSGKGIEIRQTTKTFEVRLNTLENEHSNHRG